MLQLPRILVNQLLSQAQDQPEQEICGLISQKNKLASRCYSINNIAEDTRCLYRLDPAQQIAAMREMRDKGEELLAIYHSHPRSPAEPSITDLREANYPEAVYLIISLNTTGVLEMRGFRIQNNEVREVKLELSD